LLQRIRKGDESAFNQLVLKYRHRVMGVAARMLKDRSEAEDLSQDVFVKVYHSLKTFKGEALFSTWLHRITANSCLTHRKKRRFESRGGAAMDEPAALLPDRESNPHDLLEKKELRLSLERAIQELPREQRMVLILRDIEGLSYEDIADSLSLELGTVRSRLHRARLAVQANLQRVVAPVPERSGRL